MKFAASLFVLIVLCVAAAAQQDPPRVVAAIGGSESVKNAPFSAEAVSDSVQTLFDGNRIVHNSTTKIYRNSEGRVRREMGKGTGFGGVFYTSEPGITIMNPLGSKYWLDANAKIATEMSLLPLRELNIVGTARLTAEQKAAIEKLRGEYKLKPGQTPTAEQKAEIDKLHAELRAIAPATAVGGIGSTRALTTVGPNAFSFSYSTGPDSKYETKTEELGSRDIEGVMAEGTRRITTIPAGAIGNDRAIETVYERWYSKELQMVVMSKTTDPRFGEQTYRLTNIVRAEPDPSLFSVPTGYKVISSTEGGNDYYRVYTRADAPRPAKAPKAIMVGSTKP